MSTVTVEQLEMVRQWAAEGVDLNGIQKRLASECGVHMMYMDVRFLLLDHGIEIATAAAPAPVKKEESAPEPQAAEPAPATGGKPMVTLDELTLPGTLISGKVSFPSGTQGAWQIDSLGRFAWSDLSGQPTEDELRAFQMELTQILSRA